MKSLHELKRLVSSMKGMMRIAHVVSPLPRVPFGGRIFLAS
jgi:hypothetical protein